MGWPWPSARACSTGPGDPAVPGRLRSGLRIATAVMVVVLCGLASSTPCATGKARTPSPRATRSFGGQRYLAAVIGFALVAIHLALHAGIEVVYLAAASAPRIRLRGH